MLLFTLAFGGCSTGRGVVQGSSDSPAPAASSGQPLSACGSLTTHPSYTQQYLYAGNLWGAPVLTVFKIDASTGALSEMPWSPISTFNGVLSATTTVPARDALFLLRASLDRTRPAAVQDLHPGP